MKKKEKYHSFFSFFRHIFFEIVFVLLILILLVFCCKKETNDFILELKGNFALEILFAIITTVLIMSVSRIFKYCHDIRIVKILDGYWSVSRFEEELYVGKAKTVTISRTDDLKTMKIEMIDIENGEESNGLVFISENNNKIGKIYFKTGWFQDVLTNGTMCEHNYYVEEAFSSKFKYLIRLINQQGEEFMCLSKPKDQKRYFSLYNEAISNLNLKRGQNNISEDAERILNNL